MSLSRRVYKIARGCQIAELWPSARERLGKFRHL